MSALVRTLGAAVVLAALVGGWCALRDDPHGSAGDSDGSSSATLDAAPAHGERAKRSPSSEPAGPPVASEPPALPDLDPERDLSGVVVDRDDRPVKDAHVTAHPFDLLRWTLAAKTAAADAAIGDARSAADGSFRLRLAAGTQTLVRTAATGFAEVEMPYLQSGQKIRVVLDPPTTLRVRVNDSGGGPCVGASVSAGSAGRNGDPSHWKRSADTDAAGVVSWDGLPRGRSAKVRLDVSPGLGRAPIHAECALEDRDVNETVVTLAVGRAVEGRVVDAETGIGVGDARIFVDPRRPAVAVSRSDGSFRFEGWTTEPRWTGDRVVALADGFAATTADVPAPKETKTITIALRRGFDVTGVVVGPEGRPVVGAQVVAIPNERPAGTETILDATTNEAGAFRLGWFPAAAATPLSVMAAGFAPTIVPIAPPAKGQTTVDLGAIVVAPGRTMRGHVVDESGTAKSGMYVRIVDPNDEQAAFAPFRTTSDDGRFAFAGIGVGRRRVSVFGRGPERTETKVEIDVPADVDPPELTVVVGAAQPKPPAKVVLGARFADENGQPVPSVPFGVSDAAGGFSGVVKAGDGGALDLPCDQEPQFISTRLEGDLARRYLDQFVVLRPGATAATIVLKRAAPVSGTVVDAAGMPIENAWVEALIGSRQVGHGMTDAAGRFSFGVPPGASVDVEAHPTGAGSPPPSDIGECRGVAAGSSDVTIRVVPVAMDRALDVVLVLPDGHVAGKCDVWANFQGLDQRKQLDFRMTFDATGHARFERLPRGPVRVRAMVRLAGDDEKTYTGVTRVRVDAEATSVRIVVPGFRTVRGRVIDESGAPSLGAYVFSTAAQSASSTIADAQGRFALRVPSDAATPFVVTAAKMPYDRKAPQSGWDVVEDGSDREMEIVLRPMPPR